MEDEIDLKVYLDVIIKRWRMIALIGVLAASIGLYQGMRQPKLYKATATVMPTDSGGGGLAMSFFGAFGGGASAAGSDKLVPILKSRVLAIEVAKSIDLILINPKLVSNSKLSEEEKARVLAGSLNGAIEAKTGSSGLFEITATWNDPNIAALVANKYVEGLGKFLNAHALNINYQLIDPAIPPLAPINKNAKQMAGMGFGVGLFLGVFVAFLKEYWEKIDRRI